MPQGTYKPTPEHCANISASLMGNQNAKGYKHSAETCAAKVGKKQSAETCLKKSKALRGNKNAKGCKRSPKERKRLRAAWLGDKNPMKRPEAVAKNAAWHQGRKSSPETCKKVGEALKGKRVGSKHPLWLGGISREPYGWDFSPELKEEVRRRDGYRCQLCGVPQCECKKALDVHHTNYDKKDNDPLNLVALCRSCHQRTNFRRAFWKEYFQV